MNRTIDRALWRAVGERVADEKAHRAVIRDLIEQGARPDAVFGMHAFSDRDAPYLSKVTALERLLLCAHPSSWPGRLEMLFQAGMDPNPFLEGFQEILTSHRQHSARNASQYNCVARMSPADGLDIHWLGFLTHFYVQHFYVYAPDEAMALLDVALEAGADPGRTPYFVPPLAQLAQTSFFDPSAALGTDQKDVVVRVAQRLLSAGADPDPPWPWGVPPERPSETTLVPRLRGLLQSGRKDVEPFLAVLEHAILDKELQGAPEGARRPPRM